VRWTWGVFAALVAMPAPAGAESWQERSRQDVEARGLATLEVHNARGRIDITPSADGRIHLTATKIVEADGHSNHAQELAKDIVVETERRGDRYVITVRYPRNLSFRVGLFDAMRGYDREYEVRIDAQVPPELGIDAHTASGIVRSEGIRGAQALVSVSGDVECRSASGRVELSSTSGSIHAEDIARAHVTSISGDLNVGRVRGPIEASTSSGAIDITGADDSVSVRSVSGDIRLERAPRGLTARSSSGSVVAGGTAGTVKAGTVSGDIRLGVREPLRGIDASSSSGAIRVALDPAVRCAIDLSTSSGSLDVRLPVEMRTMTRRNLEGRIRGGTTPVSLHSVSGDITVSGGGQ
jgi:hypothetical protein